MKKEPQSDAGMQKLADLIEAASIAMLTTEEVAKHRATAAKLVEASAGWAGRSV
jgi:hypothetical protein